MVFFTKKLLLTLNYNMFTQKLFKYKKYNVYLPLLLAVMLVIGILLGINLNFSGSINKSNGRFLPINVDGSQDKINNILNYINEAYVDTVDFDYLEEQTITSLLQNLDPHSSYIPESDFREVNDPLMGSFEGIGIEFNMINDTVMIINPITGGPSEKVGLMAGDRIVKVDDTNIAGENKSTDEIVNMLKGEKGTEVEVSIYRRGIDELLEYTITRDEIPSYSLDIAYMVDNDIGYIKLNRFAATTHNEFRSSLARLKQKEDMSKMILDLRGNGGGFLEAAIELADELLEPRNLIVYTEGRNRPTSYANATRNGAFENKPLIVLLDEWSASASEIIAGAVQDNDRGLVVGRRSFGKGLVQEQVQLGDGSALRLTVARYYTPTGRSIQKPYKEGDPDDYYTSFIDRLMDDEDIEKTDSMEYHDSLRHETPAGRTVYGGGGILPDFLVPHRTGENIKFFNLLVNMGIIYQFAFDYADINREMLRNYENAEGFVNNFSIDQSTFNEFIEFAIDNDIEPQQGDIEKTESLIKNHLKAYIGRNIYGNEAFYPVLHKKDEAFKKAVELLNTNDYYSHLETKKEEK